MNIKMTSKLLSIPPYLSTNWGEVSALQIAQDEHGFPVLLVTLKHGEEVAIPNLPSPMLAAAFELHARSLEKQAEVPLPVNNPFEMFFNMLNTPLDLPPPLFQALARNESVSSDLHGAVDVQLKHAPELSQTPDLPEALTTKMREMAEMSGEALKKRFIPIEGCNCPHCQVGRLFGATDTPATQEDEPVSDADLTFREWDIQSVGERLYRVSHPLDKEESYHVFLGTPVGCTCGEQGCVHLHAVLRS